MRLIITYIVAITILVSFSSEELVNFVVFVPSYTGDPN